MATASVVTKRMLKKQQDKELHWRDIRAVAAKQWQEWIKCGSVEVLTPEASRLVRQRIDRRRLLPSRFVYRDKNASQRSEGQWLPVKAKARLCVGGHLDPRLSEGMLRTDAPTVTRTSTLVFLFIAQRLDMTVVAADVEAAFMQGDPKHGDQELYMELPREGLA